MGYDMRWVRKPDGEKEAVEAARQVFYAACAERDALPKEEKGAWTQKEIDAKAHHDWDTLPANASDRYRQAQEKVRRLGDALNAANRSYFRLNIFGMGRYRDAMADLGAVRHYYDQSTQPDYPKDVPDDYWDWEWEAERGKTFDETTLAAFARIDEQIKAWRSWSPPGPVAGIPVHKLSSNDGWIVTPEECFYAASTIRAADLDQVSKVLAAHRITEIDYWNRWVQWLADASEHGGFEVH